MNKLGYGQGVVTALDYWEQIESPMTDMPMKDVDADDSEVKLLLDAGWNHCGNDMWIDPRSTMHNSVRRDTALRFEEILS